MSTMPRMPSAGAGFAAISATGATVGIMGAPALMWLWILMFGISILTITVVVFGLIQLKLSECSRRNGRVRFVVCPPKQ